MDRIKGMEHTKKIMNTIKDVLNTHPAAQKMMDQLQQKAIAENWTPEKWDEMKLGLMMTLFYQLCLEHPDMRDLLAEDVYKMFNEE